MKAKTLSSCILLLAVAACQQLATTARAAVTFGVTPSVVSNFYSGPITLAIGGLNTGETVQVDKFMDANGNGVIDAGDLPVQSFLLTDGQASVIGGVTNINVPGDSNPTNGVITAQLSIAHDVTQQIVAQYLFRLSSPTNGFTPITKLFNVTNSPYAQSFTGTVRNGGTNVPNVVVMAAPANSQKGGPLAGVMADNAGSYTLTLPGGTYSFWLFKSNFVANLSQSPTLTLTNGATFTTNLHFLIPATTSVSGHLVDAANTNTGVPGIFMICQTSDRQFMAGGCYTGTNGAFSVPVIAGQWEVSMASEGLAAYGYLSSNNNNPQADTTTGSVSIATLALPKATALFYGTVLDSQSHPFAGLDIYCQDNNQQYEADYYTDTNGYFVAPVVGGLNNDSWRVQVSSDVAPANYLFSQPSFNQNGGTNLSAGQAVLVNFTAVLATNHISGWLKDNSSNPIAGVGVWAEATINGVYYHQGSVSTDTNGNYSLNVANGTWTVGVSTCYNCNDGLPDTYLSPTNQPVVITNNNGTANFTALAANHQITGHVQLANSTPIVGVGVGASATINGVQYMQYKDTDGNGNYSFNVANGTWVIGLNPSSGSDSLDSILGSGTYQPFDSQTNNIVNNNAVANFTIQPSDLVPLQITTSDLPSGTVGVPYNASLGATGGQPSYHWWLPGGTQSLPPGQSGDMSFSPDGTVSGTPSTSGTYVFWVGVYDSASPANTVTQQVSLTINQSGSGSDVVNYYVLKMESFLQIDPANFVLNTNFGSFNAYLGLVQSEVGVVPLANVMLPSGSERALPWGSSGLELQTRESFPNQAAIDAAYPPGNYTFGLYCWNDGLQFPELTMPSAAYPNPPHISNFNAAQAINPLTPFTLQWDSISGATTNDSIWVIVTDTGGNPVFSTQRPSLNRAAALPGTATSVLIPTNTFQTGHAYLGWISYYRTTSVNMSAYPGVPGVTLVAAQTTVPLAMASTTSSRPRLDQPDRLSPTQFRFQLSAMTSQNYTIQVSTNLASTNWFPLLTTNLLSSPVFIQDNQATNKQRYYRVKVGP